MTEYDYSEEGRRRYIATQNRIAKWVHDSESSPQLKSPFSPRSNTGSDATVRQQQYGPSRPSSHRSSTMQFSRGPTSQHSHRTSQASGPPPSRLSSQIYPASQGGSRAPASTVHPSQSISQAPSQRMESSPSHHHRTGRPTIVIIATGHQPTSSRRRLRRIRCLVE
ncbi:hypothetical protein B0H10DRAFT_986063 [Mycena sp. CBHHK59/15]|nr:hypothetical protein B0H10DRAFT_986063 [Mycena sp. CBHHK59/15]